MKTRKLITEVVHTSTSRDVNNENNIDNIQVENNERSIEDQQNDRKPIKRNNQ